MGSNEDYNSSTNVKMYKTLSSRGMMIAIIVLFSVVIFILLMHLIAKWYWRYARLHMSRRNALIAVGSAGRNQQRFDGSGLDRSFIDSLPTFKYHIQPLSDDGNDDAKSLSCSSACECAVCLSEFREAENGRMLPGCNHSFHVDCIDMWLHSHSTCPICRADVLMSFKPIKEQTTCAQDTSSLPGLPSPMPVSMPTMPGSTSSSLTSTIITSSPMPVPMSTMPRSTSSSSTSTSLPSSQMQSVSVSMSPVPVSAVGSASAPGSEPNGEQTCSNEMQIDHVISVHVTRCANNGNANNCNNNVVFINEDIHPISEDNSPGILHETEPASPATRFRTLDISIESINPASRQNPWQIVRCLSMPRSCNANMDMELSPNSHPAKPSWMYRQSFKLGRQWSSKGRSIRV